MKDYLTLKRGEPIIYLLVWLLIFLLPVFIGRNNGADFSHVYREWLRMLPFLLIFLINNSLLLPKLLFKKKTIWYLGITLLVVVGISYLSTFSRYLLENPIFSGDMPTNPGHGREVPGANMKPFHGQRPPLQRQLGQQLMDNLMVSVLVVGFNSAIKISSKWQKEEQKRKEVEKQNLKNELAFLRNQVSPHFFMNTLNNIHALVDIDAGDAKEAIIKLSKMMRYLLYDSDKGETTLKKEVEFIQSYLDLMKLRFPSDVALRFSFPETIPEINIPPLLFTSLIENAFKHGISAQGSSFVDIYLGIGEEKLFFRIKNSSHGNKQETKEGGGIGLANLNKRLQLIYGGAFAIEHKDEKGIFEILIKLPLYGN